MSNYFGNFPTSFYANNVITNLISKVRFDDSVSKNLAVFYPYTLQDGERADQIAENYYEDSGYDWVIYLSNGIIDPYHEWPKDQNTLTSFLTTKYGSIANAQAQIAYYKVNYDSDESVITTSHYASLSTGQKKYWSPIISYNDTVVNYERKVLDMFVETNKVVSLTGTFNDVPARNQLIKQSSTVTGIVSVANTSTVVIRHVNGTWATSTPVQYSGVTANATITAVTTLNQPIATEEVAYWVPVTQYDVEQESNESKKHIRLLNVSYLSIIERDMRSLMTK